MNPNIDPTQKKKGTIKGVPSGDTVVFQGPPGKDGIPLEKTLRLNGINAPRLGDNEKQDEPLAYEAREFLRQRLIGREVFFYIENKFNDREYGRVIVDDEDVGALLLQEGLAKLLEDMKNKPYNYDKYREAQDSAQKKSKGVWSANAQKSVRTLAPIENPKKVLDKYKGTKLAGVVEEFRNGLFHVYVPELQSIIRITFPGIFIQVGNFKASQDVRMFLEATYLHRDVNINITNYDDKYNYFFGTITVNDNPKYNPIVELLKNGYARLTQSAVVELDAAEFKTAKAAQDEAQSKKLRMWSNFEGKKEGSATSAITGDKEFYGRVLEVHSGDTLTVENLAKGEVLRINLSNVRAPGVGNPKRNELPKPWGFEAKEFVRSQVMGKRVKVEVEFSKSFKIQNDEGKEENRTLVFATVWLPNDKNLSQLLLENGLAVVNIPRADEEFTQHLKTLKDAEELAKTKKVGQYSSKNPIKFDKYNDYSAPKMGAKAKQFFEFVKDESRVAGVVEAVLSGSLFKIRLDKQNCFILFSLAGVRTLSADKNIPQYEHFAKEAIKYSKENAFQRDVDLDFSSISPKGVFQGALFIHKKNYAQGLLESGLAYVEGFGRGEQRYLAEYKGYEKTAQNNKAGIWGAGIPVGTSSRSSAFKTVNETKTVICSEAYEPEEFYLQYTENQKTLDSITKSLADFKSDSKLEPPVKKGTPCVARFSDGKWYRAKIEKVGSNNKFGVIFTDYGNVEDVSYDDIRKLPSNLLAIEPQAKKCALAYVAAANKDTNAYDDSCDRVRDLLFDKKLVAQFCYEDSTTRYCLIYEKQSSNIKDSINYKLLKEGLVRLDETMPLGHEQLAILREAEDEAKNGKKGGWKTNDFAEPDEDEY